MLGNLDPSSYISDSHFAFRVEDAGNFCSYSGQNGSSLKLTPRFGGRPPAPRVSLRSGVDASRTSNTGERKALRMQII